MRSKILTLRKPLVGLYQSRYYASQRGLYQSRYYASQRGLYQSRYYASQRGHCDAHMNELPVPCKPWQPWYSDKQSFYNKHLAFGIVWCLFSAIMALYTDSIYLNWGPPAQPSAPSDMVEECDDSDT